MESYLGLFKHRAHNFASAVWGAHILGETEAVEAAKGLGEGFIVSWFNF